MMVPRHAESWTANTTLWNSPELATRRLLACSSCWLWSCLQFCGFCGNSVGPKHRRETGKQTSLYYLLIVYILNHSNTCLIEFNRVSMFVFVYDIFIIDLLEVFDDAKSTLQEFGALRCKCPRAFSADLGKTSLKIVCSSDSCTTLHSLAQNGVAGWPFMEFSRPGNILNLPVASSGSLRHASSSSQS